MRRAPSIARYCCTAPHSPLRLSATSSERGTLPAPPSVSTSLAAAQDAYAALGAGQHAAINHANALPLFPRVAALAR